MTSSGPSLQLLLLRHGIAEERSAERCDANRALTPRGRRRTEAVVRHLAALDLGAEHLITSPLVRARQTADLAVLAGLAPQLEEHPALAPAGGGLEALAPLLEPPLARARLLLVGHEPDLGDLGAELIGAPRGSLVLKKAGVALLEGPLQGWGGAGA